MALLASELRQRVRGRRWWIVLAVWTLILTGLVAAVRAASLEALVFSDLAGFVGPAMFGALALLVLALASLVVPALTSTAINGERDRGTLAVLQATLLRPYQIVLAKFLASWITATAFLVVTIPLAIWAGTEGGVGFTQAIVVYIVLAILMAVLAAIGLAASATISRPSLSTVSAYGTVFFLSVLLPVFFAVALATAPERTERRGRFATVEKDFGSRWIILAPDPFVVLADAAPRSPNRDLPDVLGSIRDVIREVREGNDVGPHDPERAPVWPTGLAIDVGLGAAALGLATVKLRVPARRLAGGQRIA